MVRVTTNPMRAGSCSSKFPTRVSGVGAIDADAKPGQITATIARKRTAK
jgi:hypothetical protein